MLRGVSIFSGQSDLSWSCVYTFRSERSDLEVYLYFQITVIGLDSVSIFSGQSDLP